MSPAPATLGEFLVYYAPDLATPAWPPDVFGIATLLLQKSGAYTCAINEWPPGDGPPREWVESIKKIAEEWRTSATSSGSDVPPRVSEWWTAVDTSRDVRVDQVVQNQMLREALLQLCAAADEACLGVGIPPLNGAFEQEAAVQLLQKDTLCKFVDASRLVVLPKLHTPHTGMTVRSLSHNLAVCLSSDLRPQWRQVPALIDQRLNLLLVPWPKQVLPSQFQISPGNLRNMEADEFGFFRFVPEASDRETAAGLERIIESAQRIVPSIDGVLLPELALTRSLADEIRVLVTEKQGRLLIMGVAGTQSQFATNSLEVHTPLGSLGRAGPLSQATPILSQDKHHRWKLDAPQILQYGLGGVLDPRVQWWEHIALEERRLTFLSFNPWLTMCVLICEDLARQDPIAQVVRAVGPNLVIALLMDGPQLPARWPARYATVLADDPGCSVLTLTSLGMTRLCRPPGKKESRSIALWKDARGLGPMEIELPDGAEAVVISLTPQNGTEWSADGRSDQGKAGYPTLSGVHPVYVENA